MNGSDELQKQPDESNQLPAIPPWDYKGSIADWHVELISRGLWDGDADTWIGDIWIDQSVWWEILEACEGT